MEFVTIHTLSRELNVSARVIRYHLLHLIAEGNLREGQDFRRDNFIDDQHFSWAINPVSFVNQTGLRKDPPLTNVPPIVNNPLTMVNHAGNHANTAPQHHPSPSPQPQAAPVDPGLYREMVDLLKEQIKVKDSQIDDLGGQLKETHELNLKLTGSMLRQADEIKTLLRLTGGKSDISDFVTKNAGSVNKVVNENPGVVTKVGNDVVDQKPEAEDFTSVSPSENDSQLRAA